MAYEPKVWQCGEVVSADALNHMEQGIADASSGGISIPVITQNMVGDSVWITEEDANKVFGTAPLAIDINHNTDGQETAFRVTLFRSGYDAENNTEDNTELHYSGKVEGADALWIFQFEQLIGIAYTSQGQVVQQFTLEWNDASKQYEALVSA